MIMTNEQTRNDAVIFPHTIINETKNEVHATKKIEYHENYY
jgi:hypothetical protein